MQQHPFPDYPNDVGGAGSIRYPPSRVPLLPAEYPQGLELMRR